MSETIIDSENIAEIRNALTIIQLNCQQVPGHWMSEQRVKMVKTTIEQVKRIDGLLPPIKFEQTAKLKLPGTGPDHLYNDEITKHKKSYLKVENKEGASFKSPQALIHSFLLRSQDD